MLLYLLYILTEGRNQSQQIRGLVERLMESARKETGGSTATNNNKTRVLPSAASTTGTGGGNSSTVMFKRVAVPTSESDLANLDLNVVSDVSKLTWSASYCIALQLTALTYHSISTTSPNNFHTASNLFEPNT